MSEHIHLGKDPWVYENLTGNGVPVFIVGPESSGNRLIFRVLTKSNAQFVLLRSMPHGGLWPHVGNVCEGIRRHTKKEPLILIPTRDMWATAMSQARVGHARRLDRAFKNIRKAYRHIFNTMGSGDVDFRMVHYDSWMQRPKQFLIPIFKRIGLNVEDMFMEMLKDGNDKYYDEQA